MKKSKVQAIGELMLSGTSLTNGQIAKRFNCTTSLVSQVRRKLQLPLELKAEAANDKPTHKQPAVGLSIEVRLSDCGPCEIKLRNGGNTLLGTVVLTSDGLGYRRPNQKVPADRKLSWATLDKLMQIGIV